MRVLIAEDDDRLARAVAAGLRRRGMTVDVALDGGDALDRLAVNSYDVVVLDRDLPDVHGDEICRRLELSPKEFALLECLLAAAGRPLSAEELLERVWDEAADPFTTTVKATINRLRVKLGGPPLIETVPRGGYRIPTP